MSRHYEYKQMESHEFESWLEQAGWPDGYRFAKAFGFDPSRIKRCLNGDESVSPTQAICAILVATHPEIKQTLFEIGEARATMKEPTPPVRV
jgi:hypothetical protein